MAAAEAAGVVLDRSLDPAEWCWSWDCALAGLRSWVSPGAGPGSGNSVSSWKVPLVRISGMMRYCSPLSVAEG